MADVASGHVAGPFADSPFNFFQQSPLGLVPKQGSNKTRTIFDLSHPHGESVNVNTPADKATVKYENFPHAVKLSSQILSKIGKCWLGKTDLKSAFR